MNIYLLTHDPLFYVLLAFLVEHGVGAFVAYRFLKPFASMLRFMNRKSGQPNTTPASYFSNSSLRSKLHGAKN